MTGSSGDKGRPTGFGRVSKYLSFVSALVLAFGVGVGVMQFRVFPYQLIRDAKNALDSLRLLEDETLMTGVLSTDADAPPTPTVMQIKESAGTENLLVAGGFFRNMDTCPRFGCVAWIIDRSGEVLFSWEIDPEEIVAKAVQSVEFSQRVDPGNIYPIGTALLPDGSLILTFHTRNNYPYQIGIAKISAGSEIMWVNFDNAHHWIDVDDAGRIYAPSTKVIDTPEFYENTPVRQRCFDNKTFYDGIRIYDADGSLVRDLWIGESFAASNYPGVFYSVKSGCNPSHVNSVQVVNADIAEKLQGVDAGDLLISAREPGVVAIMSSKTGLIKMMSSGRTAAQHGPQFLPDGTVAIFDNLGNDRALGGTRILRLDLATGDAETIFPRDPSGQFVPLKSDQGGHLSVSPDGLRLIFTSPDQSRVVEIDIATGEPLWTMEMTFDISRYLELKGVTADANVARFGSYGVTYIDDEDLDFMAK